MHRQFAELSNLQTMHSSAESLRYPSRGRAQRFPEEHEDGFDNFSHRGYTINGFLMNTVFEGAVNLTEFYA